eukprot:scaffold101148_cov15-Tisochrysis_lutea.AAC.1
MFIIFYNFLAVLGGIKALCTPSKCLSKKVRNVNPTGVTSEVRASPCMLILMLMAGNQEGQAGVTSAACLPCSTCSPSGGGKEMGEVLPEVPCREQDV